MEKTNPIWECFYTKKQVLKLYSAYALRYNVPKKNEKVYISHPNNSCTVVTWTDKKSPYKERLYSVELFT